MQKLFFSLLFIMMILTARSQITIVSVSPDTVCPSGTFTTSVSIHFGPDRSIFTDSLRVSGYTFPPDTFKYTPHLAGHTFPDSLSFYFDTTMLNTTRTISFISSIHDTGAFYLSDTTRYYNTTHMSLTLWSSDLHNSDTFNIHHAAYPNPTIMVDSIRSICQNATINLTASGPTNHGIYLWVNPHSNDTTVGKTVIVNGDSLTPIGYNNIYRCIYIDTSKHCNNLATTKTANIIVKTTPFQDICAVTLDSTLTHNVIVWDKNQPSDTFRYSLIDSFLIMRGNQQIGSQPFTSYSSFQDNNANISLQAWTYSITAKDVCGLLPIYFPGNSVTTMFQLQPNNGDVTWYPYQGSFSGTYSVMRDANGNNNWTLLDTITANTSPITVHDTNAAILPNTRYRIEAVGASCNPRTAYTLYSNIRSVQPNGIEEINAQKYFVYPNPTSDILYFSEPGLHLTITNIEGQRIVDIDKCKSPLDVSGMASGVYLVLLNGEVSKWVKY